MNSALDRRRIDKRGLALSVAFHLVVLLLFLISRRRSPEIVTPPILAPPMTMDLSVGPTPEPADKLQKPNAASKPQAKEPAAKVVSAPAPSGAPQIAAPPAVQPIVPPLVQLPTFASNDTGSANVANPSAGTGTTGLAGADRGNGSGSGSGASGGGGGGGGAATAERPDWIEQPTQQERLMTLSGAAHSVHASGWAILSCLVTRSNRVRHCKVLGESADSSGHHPYGFGESALRLSLYFRIRPPMRNGQPRYDIPVRIPVYWNWD